MGATSEHFSNQELSCKCAVCGGANECRQELVDALEVFRTAVGQPVIVDSAYRCPAHNAAVGGVPDSEHTQGIAADVRVTGLSAQDLYLIALKIPAFGNGGIGVAPTQSYVHLDTRAVSARWAYDTNGKWCEWNLDLPKNA